MRGGAIGRFTAWLAGLVLAVLAVPAQAAHAPAAALKPCVARAQAGDTPAALLAAPARFDCATAQTEFGPGDYWVRLDGIERAPAADALRLASVWQDATTLHVAYADGRIAARRYDSRALTRQIQLGAIVQLPIPPRGAPVTALLLRIEGSANLRGIALAPQRVTAAGAQHSALMLTALYAGFAGLGLALLFYNFVLWLTMRHRFQLFYCAMILAMLGYAFTSSGAAALAFPGIDNNDRLRVNYVLLALVIVSAAQFLGTFFDRSVMTALLRRMLALGSAAAITSALTFALFAPFAIGVLDRAYFLSFTGLLALLPALLWRAWRSRSEFLGLFAIAWSAPIAVALLRALHGFGVIPYSFWLDNSTILAMALESLLSSLVIAYRIKLLGDERDLARAATTAATVLACTDPLTGTLNRRAFLDRAIGRTGEWRLLLLDIDHFKAVNDRIGHDGGDDALKAFALALRKWQPDDSLVARLGGEEFGVLIRAADCADYPPETLLQFIRNQRMPADLKITASLGVADGRIDDEEAWKSLYRRADMALYSAKAAGRDRFRAAGAEAAPRAVA